MATNSSLKIELCTKAGNLKGNIFLRKISRENKQTNWMTSNIIKFIRQTKFYFEWTVCVCVRLACGFLRSISNQVQIRSLTLLTAQWRIYCTETAIAFARKYVVDWKIARNKKKEKRVCVCLKRDAKNERGKKQTTTQDTNNFPLKHFNWVIYSRGIR